MGTTNESTFVPQWDPDIQVFGYTVDFFRIQSLVDGEQHNKLLR
jgi:hypothetical protein